MKDIFLIYLAIVNIAAFLLMGIDKRRAVRHRFRIPEKVLFTSAFLGGSAGAYIGMQFFRHKTKHKSFVIGIPFIFFLQVAAFTMGIIL